jgi:UTP--glucose-1-phosphate uridylyltransferase
VLDQTAEALPYIELDHDFYKLVGDFDKRFPEGAPSLVKASSLRVEGDWTFGAGVEVVGDVSLHRADSAQRIAPGTVLADG